MEELVSNFEKGVRFNCHSVESAVRRSESGQELRTNAAEAFPTVIRRLAARQPESEDGLGKREIEGLANLADDLATHLGRGVLSVGFKEYEAWVAWAKQVETEL